MNPHQQNKVDISKLSADEQRLFRLYGKLPNKKDLLQNKLKERKYFDSGDYALSKAGKASDIGVTQIGREHPVPEKIPHSSPPQNGGMIGISIPPPGMPGGPELHAGGKSGSPVREGTFLHRETSLQRGRSVDDEDDEEEEQQKKGE